jgi:hypothetical protein
MRSIHYCFCVVQLVYEASAAFGSTEVIAARDMLSVTLPLEGFHRRRTRNSSSNSTSNSSSNNSSSKAGKHSIASAVQLPPGYIKGAGMLGQLANAEMYKLQNRSGLRQHNSAHTVPDSAVLSSSADHNSDDCNSDDHSSSSSGHSSHSSTTSSSSGTRSTYRGSTRREDGVAALF